MAWAENAMPAAASAFLSTVFIWYLLDVRGDYARAARPLSVRRRT
jgi:hypothetical protein